MIYTKTGDKGTTSLANGERVSKTDRRIEAYGTVDELNSWIGMLRAEIAGMAAIQHADRMNDVDEQLIRIQNRLFNLGAALSAAPGEWITEEDVTLLEQWIDAMQNVLPPQRAFILPAGGKAVTTCHICRTVCRRAERRMTEAESAPVQMRFVNRFSDYLFVLARYLGYLCGENEEKWQKN